MQSYPKWGMPQPVIMNTEALMQMLDTDRDAMLESGRQILGRGRQLLFATGLCDEAGRLLPSIAEGVARELELP